MSNFTGSRKVNNYFDRFNNGALFTYVSQVAQYIGYSVCLFTLNFMLASAKAERYPLMTDLISQGTGATLIAMCDSEPATRSRCELLLIGYTTGLSFYQLGLQEYQIPQRDWPRLLPICAPLSATPGQMTEVALKFVRERPERLHEPWTLLVAEAWRTAWPCSER
jgi:hypothetical protein